MAKTQLNLKLFYKGKLLDIAKYGRDFTTRMFIGSDKHLFWQILDSSFPEKFQLITKKGEQFYLNVGSKMQFAFDADTPQKATGKEVLLTNDKTGKLSIGNDWAISYEFMEPWVKVLTDEERQIVNQYSRRAELLPFEKFTRNFLIAATAVTIIGIILFDTFKPEVEVITSLEQYTQKMEEIATKVEVTQSDLGQDYVEEAKKEEEAKEAPVATPTGKGGTSTGTMSKAEAKAALTGLLGAGGFDPGSTGKAMAFTTEENIVASSIGGNKGGGGGGGKGPGKGGGFNAAGAGFGSVFDPTEVPTGTANLAGLSTGRPKGKLSTAAPTGGVSTYVGDVSRIVALGKVATRVSSNVLSKFSGPTVKKVTEGNLSAAPAETRPELQRVEQRVARNKPQIKDLFNRSSQIKSMYGSLRFTLYIESDGSVAGVQITPLSGEFYPEFLSQLDQLIRAWRFDNKTMVPYEFIMTFTK
jgi:hypothetical protein